MRFLRWLWRTLNQCTCAHSRAQVIDAPYKGYGVAEIYCPDCDHRETWEYTYDEPDHTKQGPAAD